MLYPQKLYRLPALREHALACILKDIVAISIAKIRRDSETAKRFVEKVLIPSCSARGHCTSKLDPCSVYATPMLQKGKGTPKERQRST